MKYIQTTGILISLLFIIGCNGRYSRDTRDFSFFERITHERTDDDRMEEFIDSLILRMNLTEKIGQMTQLSESVLDANEAELTGTGAQSEDLDSALLADLIRKYQVGSFLSGGARTAEEWYKTVSRLQKINLENSKNKIPIIFGIDHVHGTNYILGGTVFPHQINLGATFDSQYASLAAFYTAKEASSLGHHWNFAPVLDIGEIKLWSRLYETFGEDSYLASVMGAEYIKSLQQANTGPYTMAACAKHFLGYSIPLSGWDRTPVEISDQRLYEVFVPPFKAAIDSGVMSVMANSGELNGIPVHSSYKYLTTLLRDELQFSGVLITDYQDIIKLNTEHRVTENELESTYVAIMAGIDVAMTPMTTDFCDYLKQLVEEDRIPEERIDLSVRRILRLKYKLGLFDNPFPSTDYFDQIGSKDAHSAARNAAAESIVLIKNDRNLLPMARPSRLVITGSNADSRMALCGGWTYSWQGNDESLYPETIKTVVEAVREEYENTTIVHTDRRSLNWHARTADAIIVVTGEKPYAEGFGNIDDLSLPESEIELIETAVNTGKPVILVLLEGRPRILNGLFDECNSVLFAGLPGMFGAEAIAGILKGRINPSGKMSITYPLRSGHIIPYNHKHTVFSGMNTFNEEIQRYTIAEFGTGKSYTSYEYAELQLSDSIITQNETLNVNLVVKNTGQREGKEAVLWFISDEVASITRPVKELVFFEKKFLLPGEMKEFSFTIVPERHLSFPDEKGTPVLESGYFTLAVGPLRAGFKLEVEE